MKILLLLLPLTLFCSEISLTPKELHKIGLKVWQNECHGTVEGLVSWNENEAFPSLGLGHFIWHPKGTHSPFEETFPTLIEFLRAREVEMPSWISSKKGFPWKTRDAFFKDKRSKKVRQLRELLSTTLDHQIAFLFERFQETEEKLLPKLTKEEAKLLKKMKKQPNGVYALIDYTNFKGTGLSSHERYRGHGWGLLQVLQGIPQDTPEEELTDAFIVSAKKILQQRVNNAPPSKGEKRWLKGWFKRLETYSN